MSLPELALWLLLAACSLYYLAAILAAVSFHPRRRSDFTPPASILKPIRGLDPQFYACLRSHAAQDYPEFEILFAVRDPNDPAAADVRRLTAEFPRRRIELFVTDVDLGPNEKVNSLERLRRECRHDVLVIDDSDILVGPDYLRRVVAPLSDPGVGLVTCLYRGVPGGGLPSLLEALWIATDFQPSVLVARMLGIRFALGATMAVRRQQLDEVGGFAALAEFLADDYQLGKRLGDRGYEIAVSDTVVETMLPRQNWRTAWRHRLRWARTLRVCRPAGYAGMLVTFAIPISAAALVVAPSTWPGVAVCLVFRLGAALAVGLARLRDPVVLRYFWLMPLTDLLTFALWLGSFLRRQIDWRAARFQLDQDGRIHRT